MVGGLERTDVARCSKHPICHRRNDISALSQLLEEFHPTQLVEVKVLL